ncbi:MAG: F0F1 ATP synthase subunit B [Eubacterium sp.]|nr:F0F1 ATP synthase subunit B [Eubacterium sp.]
MLKFDLNFLWTIINLILFFVLMRFLLFKPIKKILTQRQEMIDNQFKDAENAREQAYLLKNQYESELAGVEDEKKQIITDARADAKAEYDKIVNRAQSDADRIKSDARKAADAETEKARLSVKEGIAQLAMETAAKVVGEKSSAEIDSSIYDKFLNESSDD